MQRMPTRHEDKPGGVTKQEDAAMAYADTPNTTRKTATAVAVLALEAGLALALVKGLTMEGGSSLVPHIITTFIRDDKPKPPPPPPHQDHKTQDVKPLTTPKTPFDQLKSDGGLILPTATIPEPGTGGIAEVKFPPIAPPPPHPSFAPHFARPKGSPGGWVSPNDYPSRDLTEGHEGLVRFQLEVTAQGKVAQCSVLASSGYPGLDAATCDKLARRAKFDPASDETGAAVPGTYTGAVRWQIPE